MSDCGDLTSVKGDLTPTTPLQKKTTGYKWETVTDRPKLMKSGGYDTDLWKIPKVL